MDNERGALVFLLGVAAAFALSVADVALGDESVAENAASTASRPLVVALARRPTCRTPG